MDVDVATLLETNRRLNRRCQRLESLVAKYRRRYISVQKPAKIAYEQVERMRKSMHDLWGAMYAESWRRRCFWCRFRGL